MSSSIPRIRSTLAPSMLFVLYLAVFLVLDQLSSPFQRGPRTVPWYPGAGLNFALLLTLGPGFAPAVLLATVAAASTNLWEFSSPLLWMTAALTSTAGYTLAALLLRRVLRGGLQFGQVRDVLAFVSISLGAPAVIGLVLIPVQSAGGLILQGTAQAAWYEYWIGEVVGIVALAPFLLLHVVTPVAALLRGGSWRQVVLVPLADQIRRWFSRQGVGPIVAETAGIVGVIWLAFWSSLGQQFAVLLLCFVPLHWIATHRGMAGVTTGILVLDLGALLGAQASGFTRSSMADLQAFVLVLSVSGLYVGAIVRSRHETEEALRKSEGLYRAMARNFPNGAAMLFDRDLRYTLADGAGLAPAGLSKSMLEGKTIGEVFPPALCAVLEPHYRAALAGREETFDVPYGDRIYQVFAIPIRDEQGNVLAGMAMTQDVTERIRSQQLLEERVAQRTTEIQRLLAGEQQRMEQMSIMHRELQALYDADEALYGSLSVKHVLNALVDKATELLRADKSTVMVWDKAHEHLIVGAARGFKPEVLPQMVHARGEGITPLVATTGKPIMVEDVANDTRVARRITDAEGIRSLIHVPITIGGEIFGVFGVNYCQQHTFTEEEQRILTTLAQRAAIAIQNAHLYDQAQQAASLEERQRLARELHDSVSQALYGIALGARTAREQLARDPSRASEPLDYVLSLAEAGLTEMRALIFELRPESLETEGLVAALSKQAAAAKARHGLIMQVALGDEPQVSLEVKQAVYRIAQEALQNTIKHAHATRVEMRLVCSVEGISLELSDNGIGFDTGRSYPGHVGLRSMQERAALLGGKLELTSEPQQGTRVRIHIPATPES